MALDWIDCSLLIFVIIILFGPRDKPFFDLLCLCERVLFLMLLYIYIYNYNYTTSLMKKLKERRRQHCRMIKIPFGPSLTAIEDEDGVGGAFLFT